MTTVTDQAADPRPIVSRSRENVLLGLDIAGMAILGGLSFGYFLMESTFAENHLSLPFLDFPVFIGEIGIALCIVLLALKYAVKPQPLTKWHWLIAGYFGFVAAKGLYGYLTWGPLACRNAALLYYPICAVFGYSFFRREVFNAAVSTLIVIAVLVPMWRGVFYDYWIYTGIILTLVLAVANKNNHVRGVFIVLLCLLTPFASLFRTARMAILGNFIAGTYCVGLLAVMWRISARWKWGIFGAGLGALLLGVIMFSDPNEAVSIVNVKKMSAVYNHYEQRYQQRKETHTPYKYGQVKVFNPDNQDIGDYIQYRNDLKERMTADNMVKDGESAADTQEPAAQHQEDLIGGYKNDKSIVTYSNAVYRLLVWRDLLEEYAREKPLLGFDFGKPFRSHRLEVLGWGGQWRKDGWVPVHNSLLHMMYRTGIVGMALILSVIILFVKLSIGFVRMRSVIGVLLLSVMVTWGVCANFLLTLEFPYTAVPVWALYGMIFAYYQMKVKETGSMHDVE